jgi:ubiquinone/menaquinone biosynthesis C-methylase UbiE
VTLKFEGAAARDLSDLRQSAAGQAKLQRFLALLDPQPGEQIIDVGCGSGEFCRCVAPRVASNGHVTGVDVSAASVSLAGELSGACPPDRITYGLGDAHALRFGDGSFDAASCISVLAFCREPGAVLRELRRVLRPGGRLLLVNSDDDSRFYNGRDRGLGRRIARAIADRCVDPWAGRRLAAWLEQAGFSVVRTDIRAEIERTYAPGHTGYMLAQSMREYVVDHAGVGAEDYARWLADLEDCADDGSYCYGATSYAYVART